MSKVNFYVASIVKGGRSGLVPPDERQDARRLMTGVAIYAQSGSRVADPTSLIPVDGGPTGEVAIATPDKREYFDLTVAAKTEHRGGQQYITPHDLAVAVHSMIEDDKHGGKDRLPVLDRTTGRVSFELNQSSAVAVNLRQVTRTFYDLDTPKPLPTGKPEEVAKAMPAWRTRDDQRRVDRDSHVQKFTRYALCSADMAGMQESDIGRIALMVEDLVAKPAAAPGLANFGQSNAAAASVSAFGGGAQADPAAQVTKSAFRAATGPGKPHPSFGFASSHEVQRLVDLPVCGERAALIGDINQRGRDSTPGSATPVPDELDTWEMSDAELDKRHPWDAVYRLKNEP